MEGSHTQRMSAGQLRSCWQGMVIGDYQEVIKLFLRGSSYEEVWLNISPLLWQTWQKRNQNLN